MKFYIRSSQHSKTLSANTVDVCMETEIQLIPRFMLAAACGLRFKLLAPLRNSMCKRARGVLSPESSAGII